MAINGPIMLDSCMTRSVPGTEVLFSERQIAGKIDQLGKRVASDYESILMIGVLTGAYAVTTNLAFALFKHGMSPTAVEVDFMAVTSYAGKQTSSGEPKITKDTKNPIRGKQVLLVEDIVDTGYSIAELINMLKARGPASLAVLSLLSKPSRREVEVPIKYLGFEIPDVYVYGYGVDDGYENYRILPYIGYKV